MSPRDKPRLPASAFDGELVHLAFNLNQCKTGRPRKTDFCYTIAEARGRGSFGRVRGYIDSALIEDPTFITSGAILRSARKKGQRQVFAWVRGVLRDPHDDDVQKELGLLEQWAPLTVCPFTDETFMIPVGPQQPCRPGLDASARPGIPIDSAKWAYFDLEGTRQHWRMRAIVMPHEPVPNAPASRFVVRSPGHLSLMAYHFGGDITT